MPIKLKMNTKASNSTFFGPVVILIRETFDGEIHREFLNAYTAVCELLNSSENGEVYYKGWINWNLENINSRAWDMSP